MKSYGIVDPWGTTIVRTHFSSSPHGFAQVSMLPARMHRNRVCSSPKPYSLSTVLCLLFCFTSAAVDLVVCQEILFTSGPQNQTIMNGGTVRFDCVYEGSFLTPSWRINTTIYSHSELPREFEFNDNNFSLTVQDVPLSLNYTAFQCVVGTAFSSRAWLIVERNETATIECIMDCVTPTSTLHTSPNDVSNTTANNATSLPLPDDNFDNNSRKRVNVTVIVAATVPTAIILLVIIITLGVLVLCQGMSAKTNKERRISTGENEAYSVVKRYQRSMKTQTNPSYELTNMKLASIDRCQSPHA